MPEFKNDPDYPKIKYINNVDVWTFNQTGKQNFKPCKHLWNTYKTKRSLSMEIRILEHCLIETGIALGKLGVLKYMTVLPTNPKHKLAQIAGAGEFVWTLRRMGYARQLFGVWETYHSNKKQFMRKLAKTKYYKTEKKLHGRIRKGIFQMYKNMKEFGQLVHNPKSSHPSSNNLYYYDIPLAIDYFGYIKPRNGSHRRMVAHALGWKKLLTIVVDFNAINNKLNTLTYCPKEIRDIYTVAYRKIKAKI